MKTCSFHLIFSYHFSVPLESVDQIKVGNIRKSLRIKVKEKGKAVKVRTKNGVEDRNIQVSKTQKLRISELSPVTLPSVKVGFAELDTPLPFISGEDADLSLGLESGFALQSFVG